MYTCLISNKVNRKHTTSRCIIVNLLKTKGKGRIVNSSIRERTHRAKRNNTNTNRNFTVLKLEAQTQQNDILKVLKENKMST